MSRLTAEIRRLFLPAETAPTDAALQTLPWADTAGRLRALVLELARPADWHLLAAVWKGVQADLQLPAPAIAVNGTDGLQLWFSVAEPLDPDRAHAFLEALRLRYLAEVPRHRVTLLPTTSPDPQGAATPPATQVPAPTPAPVGTSGHWSAFVAQDLAPLFDDTPWLDIPPGDDAQAGLLARLECIKPAQWEAALRQLQPAATIPAPARRDAASQPKAAGTLAACDPDAKRFLLAVMNDPAAPLALRIEAAKAVLPYQ